MTGRYPTRFGHEFNAIAQNSGLSLNETTLADRSQALGYATAAIGKWHLGTPAAFHPTRRGFDEFYGTLKNTPGLLAASLRIKSEFAARYLLGQIGQVVSRERTVYSGCQPSRFRRFSRDGRPSSWTIFQRYAGE